MSSSPARAGLPRPTTISPTSPAVFADEVFDQLVSLPPVIREQELHRLCQGDQSLAEEVRRLLRAHEAQASDPSARRAEANALRKDDELGPYRLHRCLGKGASAAVWQAYDTHLQSWTALKVLNPRAGRTEGALDAVMNEARAASGIISDHVVHVKNAGVIDGLHYIDMQLCAEHRPAADGSEELVVGRTLADEHPDDRAEVVRLVMEAARGVDAAHRIGVLHRDLKPANVLVMPVSRRALVADFGLAVPQLHPPADEAALGTATVTVALEDGGGVLVGTPCFMSPEQAYGQEMTRVSDVYSLGATLYALLGGRAPYEGPSGAPNAMQAVVAVRGGPPEPLRSVNRRVPRRLARIVERAMARSRRARYPTAGALADDLALYLADRPTSVDGWSPGLRVVLAVRRNLELATAAVLLGLMLLVFGAAVWALETKRVEIEGEMRVAETRRDEAVRMAAVADSRRAQAEQERREAFDDAQEALLARQRAERSEEMAEQRALQEIAQRAAAEESAREAVEQRVAMEHALAAETEQRVGLQADLVILKERLAQTESARDTLEARLHDETSARLRSEHERLTTRAELTEAESRIFQLEMQSDDLRETIARLEAQLSTPLVAPGVPSPSGDLVTP